LAELAEVRFFSKEELANLEIAFDHKKVLEKFFSDFISTKNISTQNKMDTEKLIKQRKDPDLKSTA